MSNVSVLTAYDYRCGSGSGCIIALPSFQFLEGHNEYPPHSYGKSSFLELGCIIALPSFQFLEGHNEYPPHSYGKSSFLELSHLQMGDFHPFPIISYMLVHWAKSSTQQVIYFVGSYHLHWLAKRLGLSLAGTLGLELLGSRAGRTCPYPLEENQCQGDCTNWWTINFVVPDF